MMNLETRECSGGCGLNFRCLSTSKQTRARAPSVCEKFCLVPFVEGEEPIRCEENKDPCVPSSPERKKPVDPTNADQMGESGSTAIGEPSDRSSSEKQQLEGASENTTQPTKSVSTKNEWSDEDVRATSAKTTGTGGELVAPQLRTPMKNEESTRESRLEAFIAPSLPAEGEKSVPTNLLDDSIYHLHGLMKSVGAEVPAVRRLDPDMINAQCNVASNLRAMMKLKLDIAKEANK